MELRKNSAFINAQELTVPDNSVLIVTCYIFKQAWPCFLPQ